MIAGAGGNIGVQIGSDGIVLVNAGNGKATDQVLAELKKLTELPIRYIIDADGGPEFVGGNERLAKAGFTIFTNALGNGGFVGAMTNNAAAAILAHESVLNRMKGRIDAMDRALDNVKAKGARETELNDTKARVKKLGEDLDRLARASADDWWDVSKARVSDYVDRVEASVKRLDDNKPRTE